MGCVRHHDRVLLQPPPHKGVARRKPLALAVGAAFAYKRLYAQILRGSWDRVRRQFSCTALSRYYGVHGFPQEIISRRPVSTVTVPYRIRTKQPYPFGCGYRAMEGLNSPN